MEWLFGGSLTTVAFSKDVIHARVSRHERVLLPAIQVLLDYLAQNMAPYKVK